MPRKACLGNLSCSYLYMTLALLGTILTRGSTLSNIQATVPMVVRHCRSYCKHESEPDTMTLAILRPSSIWWHPTSLWPPRSARAISRPSPLRREPGIDMRLDRLLLLLLLMLLLLWRLLWLVRLLLLVLWIWILHRHPKSDLLRLSIAISSIEAIVELR
jgi:hypothetical protein